MSDILLSLKISFPYPSKDKKLVEPLNPSKKVYMRYTALSKPQMPLLNLGKKENFHAKEHQESNKKIHIFCFAYKIEGSAGYLIRSNKYMLVHDSFKWYFLLG